MQTKDWGLLIALAASVIILSVPRNSVDSHDDNKEILCDFEVGYDGNKCRTVDKPKPITTKMQCDLTGQTISDN